MGDFSSVNLSKARISFIPRHMRHSCRRYSRFWGFVLRGRVRWVHLPVHLPVLDVGGFSLREMTFSKTRRGVHDVHETFGRKNWWNHGEIQNFLWRIFSILPCLMRRGLPNVLVVAGDAPGDIHHRSAQQAEDSRHHVADGHAVEARDGAKAQRGRQPRPEVAHEGTVQAIQNEHLGRGKGQKTSVPLFYHPDAPWNWWDNAKWCYLMLQQM